MTPPAADALRSLGIQHLSCAVHDRCLPPDARLDAGCGCPGGPAARAFLTFLKEQGFNTIQMGPFGEISPGNLSPYDGTAFSRSRLQLSWSELEGSPFSRVPEEAPSTAPDGWCDYPLAFATAKRRWAALHHLWESLAASGSRQLGPLEERLRTFRAREGRWLLTDALHSVLSGQQRSPDPLRWAARDDALLFSAHTPEPSRSARLAQLTRALAPELRRYEREQALLWAQHRGFLDAAHAVGLEVWGDLQVGLSFADRWANAHLLLEGYAMGGPPSRTNPEGQPWGYPVMSPAHRTAVRAFERVRFTSLFGDYDGMRVDHPHGLVCPWVYVDGEPDPHRAVRDGARLFSVGPSSRHAPLSPFDIATPDQLEPRVDPWADGQVIALDEAQVERYGESVALLLESARTAGKSSSAVAFEVLSTMPYPLGRVLERHALGRFRVTQKADVRDGDDVYLPANAQPQDWIMVGTHDTPPIWRTAEGWPVDVAAARIDHAVRRLAPDGVGREALARHFGQSRARLACAELAVLFTTQARHVLVWVFDLLGSHALYNRPGVVHPENWTQRVPATYRAVHATRAAAGAAFDPAWALALALAARPRDARRAQRDLIRALAASALTPVPALEERLAG